MTYIYEPMTADNAELISRWTYREPYSIYSLDGEQDTIDELLGGDYWSVLDEERRLIGFFCSGPSARVSGGVAAGLVDDPDILDIGLGMRPDLTGKGRGNQFVTEGIRFLLEQQPASTVRLAVMTFNERAIRVYEKVGFQKEKSFFSPVMGRQTEFICMTRAASNG